MSKPISTYYDATKYLGQYVGDKVEFLKETSCMSDDMRELIGYLDIYVKYFCDDERTKKFFTEKIRPSLEILGFALWRRDTVTDMALRKGGAPEEEESFDNSQKDDANSE